MPELVLFFFFLIYIDKDEDRWSGRKRQRDHSTKIFFTVVENKHGKTVQMDYFTSSLFFADEIMYVLKGYMHSLAAGIAW